LQRTDLSAIEDRKELIKLKKQIQDVLFDNSELQRELQMYKDIASRQNKELDQFNKTLSGMTIELSQKQEEIHRLQEDIKLEAEQRVHHMEQLNKTRDELHDVSLWKDQIERTKHDKDAELVSYKERLNTSKKEINTLIKERDQLVASLESKRVDMMVCVIIVWLL
jgi:chromosome segregation ATPase